MAAVYGCNKLPEMRNDLIAYAKPIEHSVSVGSKTDDRA